MLGSAIGKGDDAATFTKKEKKGVLMSSTLKGVGTGLFRDHHHNGIEPQ
jgi:hypothetical protein